MKPQVTLRKALADPHLLGHALSGDSWAPIVRDLPAVLSVEVQTLA